VLIDWKGKKIEVKKELEREKKKWEENEKAGIKNPFDLNQVFFNIDSLFKKNNFCKQQRH
jgi:hypothetical protein